MTIRQKVAMLNNPIKYLFKAGYPMGRNEYLCKTKNQQTMLDWCPYYGLKAHRLLSVGHDYNYDADIFVVENIEE